jgi:peptidoglycan/xylan/chitin deacetylase (PgdA/CDA1 family)
MKKAALGLMYSLGLFTVARAISAGRPRILMYHNFSRAGELHNHHVTVPALRVQLQYLKRHFRVLSLADLMEQIRCHGSFQPNSVVLTIDDGRRNCYEHLYPLLREFRMPATFFVISSFMDGDDWLWTDKVLWLSKQQQAPGELLPGRIVDFFSTLNRLVPRVREESILAMARAMRVAIPAQPPPPFNPCSWAELREMSDSGLVEIGSHTVTHPILSTVKDHEAWDELTGSRARIERALGKKVRFFCFPNGKPGDYRPAQLRLLKEAGYEAAVVSSFGLVQPGSDPYELPRIGISGESDHLAFAKSVDGAEHYQTRIRQSLGLRNAVC